ncbi:unnamed protein product [Orchesella dallaii]|uniref:Multidrug resistance-associated protein 4 n=1 Tax=Orchesella dallaii TaxID=48710 RepID=A0ABP1QZ45_9HEXA
MDFREIQLETSPEIKANPISKLFLLWLFPFLRKGSKADLNAGDVYKALPEDSSARLGTTVQVEWDKERKRANAENRQPKLWRVLRSIIWKKYLVVVLVCCFDELFLRTVQPLALKNFIRTFREDTEDPDVRKKQFLYAGALVGCTVGHAILFQKLINATMHIGMKMRLGISSVIYRKILKLRKSDSEQTNVGKLINLLSSDVSRLDQVFNLLHCFVIAPFQLAIFSYLLWSELGVASLGGVGCILFILPLQVLIGRFSMYYRTRIAKRTDERGRFLNEIISGVRLIKMYAWEKPFASVVAKLRRSEIVFIRRSLYLKGIFVSGLNIAWKIIPFAALILYVALGNILTADKAFFSIAVFNVILQAIMNRIPNAASQLGECLASLNRIEFYLLSKENQSSNSVEFMCNEILENGKSKHQNVNGAKQKALEPRILMSNYSASWTDIQQTLKNVCVNLEGNNLVVVVGHVGSGKSSFLNAILSELPITTGNCQVQGRLSYASQEAWIFPSSLRQNILFGLDMDSERYWKTIKLCCLSDDLKQFPDGDLTLVGERGVALSGGQKARVNLARAVYQDADIYLFDDPLSAVDTRVSKSLFNECIKEHLDKKLRILVTHQLQYLPFADHIIVLNREGGIWSQGTYEELKKSEIDFASLIDEEYFNANNEQDELADEGEIKEIGIERRRSSATEDKNDPKSEIKSLLTGNGNPIMRRNDEQKDVGSVGIGTYFRYFKSGGSYIAIGFLLIGFFATQFLHSFIDYWLSLWTNSVAENEDLNSRKTNITTINSAVLSNFTGTVFPLAEDNDESTEQNFYVYVYCGLVGLFIFVVIFRSIVFFWYCMRISINLHDGMFESLVRAPVKFFDDNPSGRVMNRFTKDLNHIDEHLPIAFFDFVVILLSLFGTLIINVAANYYTAVPSAILLFSLWKIRGFYLSSARDLKRLEALAKSPMFTHVTMTVQGLTTIRALKAESRILEQFEKIQDAHTAVYYMIFVSSRWFALWLEMMSSAFLAVVSFGFLLITSSSESGSVGVALSTIMALAGALQWGIRQSAETENYMTCVQRAFEYSNLKPEAPLEKTDDTKLHQNWPNQGRICFEKVSLSYDGLHENRVLKEINFSTAPKEKIGIVGRTGAGKSSLITALFRLTEPDGVISIDDVSVDDIGLHTLRSKISIIPQDPVLFTGSLRYNLDPFDEFVDDQLWRVLQEVDLHDAVQSLDYQVADGGSNFSVGQRQLVCLARAILRKNQILVLDEATANVDPATDHLVQNTIRTKFSDCTILTIAHRLQSVLDSDRIMVLDGGKIVEFDSPEILLQNEEGVFCSMMKHTQTDELLETKVLS